MKLADEVVKAAETLKNEIQNPKVLAELYSGLGSDEQAVFWDWVAGCFHDFGGAMGCSQNSMIAWDLTDAAKEHIANLAEHIRLRGEDKATQGSEAA